MIMIRRLRLHPMKRRHVDASWLWSSSTADLHRGTIVICIDRTAGDGIPLRSDGFEDSWKNATIAVRSNRDRTAIALRSSGDYIRSARNQKTKSLRFIRQWLGEHQPYDRPPIATRSWSNRGLIAPWSGLICHEIEALPLLIVAINPSPRSRQSATIFGPISSLKSHVVLLCSSTFDRFVKELSEFRGRSLVHHDPPAFRLNSKGIGAGLITNSSLISSNFPLEFRKSVRKDPSKFTPIRVNWSLILVAIGLVARFDRLSRGNLSFY